MDAKFQEYLDQISSEKYGDDVRSAIQHALVYLYDKFTRQNRTFSTADTYADTLLDGVWDDAIDFAEDLGVHDVERKNLIDDPDAEDGFNDLKAFTRDLVELLRLCYSVVKYNPSLSEDSSITDIIQAMLQVFRTDTIVEEVKLASALSSEIPYGADSSICGNIAVVPISNCLSLSLKLLYFNFFPAITANGNSYPGVINRPIVCLSSTLPPSSIHDATDYLLYKIDSSDPGDAPSITDFGDMVVDTVYHVDDNTGLVYPIDNSGNYVAVEGSLNLSQLSDARYLIIGQVYEPSGAVHTYYDGRERKIYYGFTGSVYGKIEMTRATFINR